MDVNNYFNKTLLAKCPNRRRRVSDSWHEARIFDPRPLISPETKL